MKAETESIRKMKPYIDLLTSLVNNSAFKVISSSLFMCVFVTPALHRQRTFAHERLRTQYYPRTFDVSAFIENMSYWNWTFDVLPEIRGHFS